MSVASEASPGGAERQPLAVRALLVSFLLAVFVRVVTALRTSVIFDDGPSFVELARAVAAGDTASVLAHPYHPLYSALMVLASRGPLDLEQAGIVCSVLGGAAAVVALHVFLHDAFGERIARMGAAFLALGPYAVRFSSDVQSDGVYLGLFLGGVALLWRALERARPGAAFGSGVLAGLAYLARPEGVGVVLVGVGLAAFRLQRGRWLPQAFARWVAALIGGFAVPATPYLWAMSRANGSWVLSGKKSLGGLLGVVETPLTVDSSPAALVAGIVVLASFGLVLRRSPRGLPPLPSRRIAVAAALGGAAATSLAIVVSPLVREYASVVVSSLGPAIAFWATVGLLVRRADRQPDRALFIGAFLALYGVVLAGLLANYGYLSRRHALPPLALLLGYAAIGTEVLATSVLRAARHLGVGRRLSPALALGLAFVVVASGGLPKMLRRHRDDALAQRRAAEWLRAQPAAEGALAATKRRTAYYADRPWVRLEPLPDGSLWLGNARYLIVDDELPRAPAGLRLVPLRRVEAAGRAARVFRIDASGPPGAS